MVTCELGLSEGKELILILKRHDRKGVLYWKQDEYRTTDMEAKVIEDDVRRVSDAAFIVA